MSNIKVVDDVFPNWLLTTIQNSITDLKQWEYGRVKSSYNNEYENYYNCVLWHKNYPEATDPLGGLSNVIASCFALELLPAGPKSLQILRLNGTTPASKQYPHRDCNISQPDVDQLWTIVWWPYSSDGGLRFWEDQIDVDSPSQIVEYKPNRAVIFPSSIPHASVTPSDWPMRVSLNSVWNIPR
jgi:hypothetical protein